MTVAPRVDTVSSLAGEFGIAASDLLALLRHAGIRVPGVDAEVSLADVLTFDQYLVENQELLQESGFKTVLPLAFSKGYLPPRPPTLRGAGELTDCIGDSEQLRERWRRQYEWFADANGLLISERPDPNFSVLRLRDYQAKVLELERQLAAKPTQRVVELARRLDEQQLHMEQQARENREILAAWRRYDDAVAQLKTIGASKIARVGGVCLGFYLGGIAGLYFARTLPAERAIVEAHDLAAATSVWALVVPVLIGFLHFLWKIFATTRLDAALRTLDAAKPKELNKQD